MNIILYTALFIIGLFVGFMFFLLLKKKIFAGEYEKITFLKTELMEKSKNELEVKKESFADLLSFLLFWCSLQYPIEVDC